MQGNAVGIGTTMLMHCDHVVAASDARFSTPFVGLGLVPEAASSLIAPRLIGQARAFSLLVMGRPLSAEDAKTAGLVNAVVAPEAVEAEAMKAAREIASLPRQGVRASRRLMRGKPDEIIARIDEEAELFTTRLQSAEARAAFGAFLDSQEVKRPQQLDLVSNSYDGRSAEAIVRRASARAFGITAISPTAITDALFFIACSVRMVREIAACYGHRPTAFATAHLLRQLVVEAGKLGAVDFAGATLTQHLGGAVAERVARGASGVHICCATHGAARPCDNGPVPSNPLPGGTNSRASCRR